MLREEKTEPRLAGGTAGAGMAAVPPVDAASPVGSTSALPTAAAPSAASDVLPASAPSREAADEKTGRLSAFAALAVPNYRLLWQGNFATQMGYGMQQVAFGWLILDLSNDPFYLGLSGFTFMFPMLVISPFGGVIADRFARHRVLLISQVILMIMALAIAAQVFTGEATVWSLLASSLIIGTTMAINVPARQALVSDLVGRDLLANAVSLHSLSLNASRIIGPSLAGVVISSVGVFGCFVVQAGGYVWSVLNLTWMKVPPRPAQARTSSVVQNLREGFSYCYRDRVIFSQLLLATAVSMLAMPASMQFLPAYARDTLGLGPGGLGLLMAVGGVGALVSSFGLALIGRVRRRGVVLIGAALLMGTLVAVLSQVRVVPLALLVVAGISASSSILMILNNTLLQEKVPDHLRGRVMSAYMITWGAMPVGAVPLGAVAASFGTPMAMLIGGTGCVVAALWLVLTRPEMRRI